MSDAVRDIARLAQQRAKTPAQVVLRWHLDQGDVAIPQSVTPARTNENIAVFDFELAADDARDIGQLDQGRRMGPDPDMAGDRPSGFSSKIDSTIT
jgi:2,5-diketo-D-gluconate reductase A